MKLSPKDFKRFKELEKLVKSNKASEAEKAEYADLASKRNERGSNDIAWWKNYPALLKDVVNLPFNWIPGTIVESTGPNASTHTLELGVLAKANLRPGIGMSVTDADAFNAQIRQLWLDLHRKYRGIGTYEKSDLGIAILAINSVFESLAKFERIYGVINSYHIGNRVVPTGLKEMLSISNDLEENLADFRYTLNLAVAKLKQLCLPKGMSVLISDIVAVSNLFKDSDNRRAFIFGFDTELFGLYDPTTLQTGGCIEYTKFSGYMNGVTPGGRSAFLLSDISNILNLQISGLLSDDDIARICSDLLAAYGTDNVMQLIEVPENYTIEPIHDYERSLQFHNMTLVGPVASIYEDSVVDNTQANTFLGNQQPIVIYQNNNTVKCRLGVTDDSSNYVLVSGVNYPSRDYTSGTWTGSPKEGDVLFDTWVEEPGEAEVMCGTRYVSLCDGPTYISTDVVRQEVVSFGTKVVTSIDVYAALYNGVYTEHHLEASVVDTTPFTNNYHSFMKLMQMDWHPIFYITSNDLEVFGDVDNFTTINRANLNRIHEVALFSGYKIPAVSAADK